jgi:hypothetical protein
MEDAADVDAHDAVEVLGAGVQQPRRLVDAGVVDKDVDVAQRRQRGVHHRQRFVAVRNRSAPSSG